LVRLWLQRTSTLTSVLLLPRMTLSRSRECMRRLP